MGLFFAVFFFFSRFGYSGLFDFESLSDQRGK